MPHNKVEHTYYQHLFEIGKQLITISEIDKLLSTAMDEAIAIAGAERGMIILLDETGSIEFQTARNIDKEDIDRPEFEISRTIIETVKTEKQSICLQNALENPRLKKSKSVEQLKLLSVICLPLVHDDKLFGVVYLDNRKFAGIFKPETCNFVEEFADFISLAAYQALERKHLQNRMDELETELRGKYKFDQIIGHHPNMVEILKLISKVADTSATVLIQGESGTGKELIAQALHYNSCRKNKQFIPVNCGAIPENLLESELFGHIRGAFTGAIKDKAGWFEQAEGGTIFLDEISEMSPSLQVRLLRVLQTGEYSPVGSAQIQHCDVRVVAASSKNLSQSIKKGDFREELYYRLNVIEIHLPPLRDRKSDILPLAQHYLKQFSGKYGKENIRLSDAVVKSLLDYHFPGNVRELVNIIQRAVVLVEDDLVTIQNLPPQIIQTNLSSEQINTLPSFQAAKQRAVEDFEREYIINCLRIAKGNITQAARVAGTYVKNFHVKMKKYGIDPLCFK